MNYEKKAFLQLLDPQTIQSMMRIYRINLKHIAGRLGISRQGTHYLLKEDRLKDYQKEIILQLLTDYGAEYLEILLIHTMIHKQRKIKK